MTNGTYQIGDRFAATRLVDVHSAVRTGAYGFRRDVAAISVPAGASPADSAAFAETATAFARLGHPHVLAVDDICVERGRPWVVARPVTGAPLSYLLDVPASRARALRIDVVVQLVRRVAEAAHALSALSDGAPLGGLSADAIWLERSGAPLLLPAVRVVGSAARNQATARFAAPEVRDGEPPGLTADVYSLALLLWDLLALGRARGRGTTTDLTTEAPFSGDAGLARLVARALSPRVAERPSHVLALRDELAALSTGAQADAVAEADAEDPITVLVDPAALPENDSSEPRTLEVGSFDGAELAAVRERVPSLRPMPAPVRLLREAVTVAAPVEPADAATKVASVCRISPKLRVLGGDATPSLLALNHGSSRWVVGRGRSSDLVILDLDMSREHFEIVRREDGQYRLYDLGSKNGSFVNGSPADDRVLGPGDRVRAGNTELRFES